jgi:hypothetical protein
MNDPEKQKKTYKTLAVVFAIAGVFWIIGGFYSGRFIIYPLIGLVNLGVAFVCKQLSV